MFQETEQNNNNTTSINPPENKILGRQADRQTINKIPKKDSQSIADLRISKSITRSESNPSGLSGPSLSQTSLAGLAAWLVCPARLLPLHPTTLARTESRSSRLTCEHLESDAPSQDRTRPDQYHPSSLTTAETDQNRAELHMHQDSCGPPAPRPSQREH